MNEQVLLAMSLQDALAFARDYSAVLSLATFVLGLIVGNKQAIGRDRRKEFNEVSQEAFVALSRQLKAIEAGSQGQSAGELLLVESYIPFYKRPLFRMHAKRYKTALQGVSTYDVKTSKATVDPARLKHLGRCARNLRSYLRRR